MEPSVFLVFGDDDYLVSAKGRELVNRLVPPEEQVLSLETVDGAVDTADAAQAALGSCIQALMTVGFFAARKVVWLKNVSFLEDNVSSRGEAVKARLKSLSELVKKGLPDGQILVITAAKADKRWGVFKACKERGKLYDFTIPDKGYKADQQASERLTAILAKNGLRMGRDLQALFIARVGVSTRDLVNEVHKLALFLGGREDVSESDIQAITSSSREAVAWDLADAVGTRNLRRALETLRRLLFQKVSPMALVAGLQGRIRDLLIYREGLEAGWLKAGGGGAKWGPVPADVETAFSESMGKDPRATHPFRVGLLAKQAGAFTRRDLRKCQGALLDAHEKLVSSRVPQAIVLESLLIRMLA